LLGGLLSFAAASPALDLHLKASAGLVRSRFGDINRALADWSASWEAAIAARPGWGFEQLGTLRQTGCVSLGAELLTSVGRRWAVGIGSGLLYSNFADGVAPLFIQTPDDRVEYTSPTKLAAYPIYGLAQFSIPVTPRWEAFLTGGMGFVPLRYVHREKFRNVKATDFGVALTDIASAAGPMIMGGVGFRYAFDPALSLFAEADYLLAQAGSFNGTTATGAAGVLYSYQEYDSDLDFWQTKLRLQAAEPAGPAFRDVRKAGVDLGGFSLRLGLQMKL
jgi:hypothetical protein